jgi:hypothetical protein
MRNSTSTDMETIFSKIIELAIIYLDVMMSWLSARPSSTDINSYIC